MDFMSARGPDPKVTDDELLDAVEADERPFTTATAVTESVPLSANRVRQRLGRLADEGVINCAPVARDIKIYWSEASSELK